MFRCDVSDASESLSHFPRVFSSFQFFSMRGIKKEREKGKGGEEGKEEKRKRKRKTTRSVTTKPRLCATI